VLAERVARAAAAWWVMQRWAGDPARIAIVDVSFVERADLRQVVHQRPLIAPAGG
jgi:hypothetical protein